MDLILLLILLRGGVSELGAGNLEQVKKQTLYASQSLDDVSVVCCRSGRSVMATREKTTQLETGAAMK